MSEEIKQFKSIKKIGLGIVAFDATEHLVNIISELRDLIDYVVVGVQKVSYHGDPIAIDDYNEVVRLQQEDRIVDDIYEVDLNLEKAPREQETDKRNHLIDMCAENGCSHCIIIDSDEFYPRKSFLKALQEIDENDYPVTYCQYINYWFDYQHYLVYPFPQGQYVPFVSKVEYKFSFENTCFPYPSDPTRRYNLPIASYNIETHADGKQYKVPVFAVQYHIFPWETVKMHHLSWLRANIRKKLNNWSSKKLFPDFEDLIDRSVERYEAFSDANIHIPAELLFNTPGHKVEIEKLPKQYIWPKYDFHTRLRKYYQQKRIIILIMSCNNQFFKDQENLCRETYLKNISERYPNIDFYFYRGKEDGSTETTDVLDINEHVMYLNSVNDYYTDTYEKTIAALKLLETNGIKYDYLIRTNTSTWLNLDLLDRFIGFLDNETINYGGAITSAYWTYHRLYMNGNAMIMPYRNISSILLNPKYGINSLKGNLDDVAISTVFNIRYINLGIDYRKYLKTVGIYFSSKDESTASDVNDDVFERYMFIQFKNFFYADGRPIHFDEKTTDFYQTRNSEFEKAHDIDSKYQKFIKNKLSINPNYLDLMYDNVIKNLDKDYYINTYIKQEYLAKANDDNEMNWHIKSENKHDRKTAWEMVDKLTYIDLENRKRIIEAQNQNTQNNS